MDDQTTKIVAQTMANLVEVAARNTVSRIASSVKKAKAGHDKDKIIRELEDLINSLTADKIELERLAKVLENELIAQRLSEENIVFIVDSIIPKIEELTKRDPKQQTYLNAIKSLLSKDTLQVMQLIGFNYKSAIGEPLTQLCANAIKSITDKTDDKDMAKLRTENEIALVQLSQDEAAYNRFAKLIGRDNLVEPDKLQTSHE